MFRMKIQSTAQKRYFKSEHFIAFGFISPLQQLTKEANVDRENEIYRLRCEHGIIVRSVR